jgi:hypothetical protein
MSAARAEPAHAIKTTYSKSNSARAEASRANGQRKLKNARGIPFVMVH